MSATPLDAVISGTAFEDATTAIGVLEKGSEGTGKISLEMLCTLDNFIQTVLFNEHIYLTVSPWIQNGQIIPGGTQYRGGLPGPKTYRCRRHLRRTASEIIRPRAVAVSGG